MPSPRLPDDIDVIVSDLDGTLFDGDHQLSVRTVEALERADECGIRVVAATGRSSTSAVPRLRPAAVITTAICSNGALVHDVHDDHTRERFPIHVDHLRRFFDVIDRGDPSYSLSWETDAGNGWDEAFAHIAREHDDLGAVPAVSGRPNGTHVTTKLMVSHPDFQRMALAERLLPHLADPVTLSCSGVDFVEVTGVHVNKATTVARLCASWDIDRSRVLAFGDNHNDVDLLRWAGHGVAMGNAAPPALEAADEVIGDHKADAVAVYIERLLGRGRKR